MRVWLAQGGVRGEGEKVGDGMGDMYLVGEAVKSRVGW